MLDNSELQHGQPQQRGPVIESRRQTVGIGVRQEVRPTQLD